MVDRVSGRDRRARTGRAAETVRLMAEPFKAIRDATFRAILSCGWEYLCRCSIFGCLQRHTLKLEATSF